jgi:transcriptional regulator GlxA family with amidase domain
MTAADPSRAAMPAKIMSDDAEALGVVANVADAGLLQGKRVTTHWRWTDRLKRGYPSILVDPTPVFVRDGKIYTSARVSVSLDLSIAMIEEDFGHVVASEVAKRLVLFVHRPGSQPQVSQALILQSSDNDQLRDLGGWISNHLDKNLTVPALARKTAMSVRNFTRRFRQSFGMAPAEFVTRVRVEAACRRLEESNRTVEHRLPPNAVFPALNCCAVLVIGPWDILPIGFALSRTR